MDRSDEKKYPGIVNGIEARCVKRNKKHAMHIAWSSVKGE